MGELAPETRSDPTSPLDGLTEAELRVYEALPGARRAHRRQIAVAAGIPPDEMLGPLATLELAGLVDCGTTAGGSWSRPMERRHVAADGSRRSYSR